MFLKKYFSWLQKDVPTGTVEKYPLQDDLGQTSSPNVYVIGDLTGIPLLKLAVERSRKVFLEITNQQRFIDDQSRYQQEKKNDENFYDIAIIGAGPAGISAAREAQKKGLKYIILEAAENPFETIRNFPKGKGMFYSPDELQEESEIVLQGDKKEELLKYLDDKVKEFDLNLVTGARVEKIVSERGGVQQLIIDNEQLIINKKNVGVPLVGTQPNNQGDHKGTPLQKTTIKALRTFLAIGKSGNARNLNVPGEDLPKVFNKLFDASEFTNKEILVVGGGDSALEAAIQLASNNKNNTVTISYRKPELARAKPENINTVNKLAEGGKIQLLLGTNVKEIGEDFVEFKEEVQNSNPSFRNSLKRSVECMSSTPIGNPESRPKEQGKSKTQPSGSRISADAPSGMTNGEGGMNRIKNDVVFTLIGREMPLKFFDRCGITLENTWNWATKWWLAFSLAFANVIYFGKLSNDISFLSGDHKGTPLQELILPIFSPPLSTLIPQIIAWLSFFIMIFAGVVVLYDLIKNFRKYFNSTWHYLKWGYITLAIGIFLWAFLGSKYLGENLLLFPNFELWGMQGIGGDPYFWYGFLYTTTIGFFGIRRIITSKTEYVTKQTLTLFLIQALPLFFIPQFILPWMNHFELIPEIIKQTVFLGEEWWRFVGFILAWPLFIWNVFTEQPSIFWLIVSLIQTFVIIPWIVIKWGKGGYCSWICSCGALAETLGDEYRNLAPHCPKWKKFELAGQWVLFSIIIVTLLHFTNWFSVPEYLHEISKNATDLYKLIVDTFLAGTLGVGLYFFFSGRFWCRFFCPLAALMHIFQKFGQYRIFADKKKCISCGICTKVCHMGIDVMNYAQRGKPMDDVECVRCSACVRECPMGVLSFGRFKEFWGKGKEVVLDTFSSR